MNLLNIFKKIILYIYDIKYELKQITYPSHKESIYFSILVIIFILIFSFSIWILDSLLIYLFSIIIKFK